MPDPADLHGPDAVAAQPVTVTRLGARRFRGFERREQAARGHPDDAAIDPLEAWAAPTESPLAGGGLADLVSSLAASAAAGSDDRRPLAARLHVGRTSTSRQPLVVTIVAAVLILVAIVKPW